MPHNGRVSFWPCRGIWRPDASWKYIHTYQHLSKGCCLNPKDDVKGTPYHPFGTPDSRWSYTWLDVDNIQIHVVDFTSGGGCMFVSNVHPEIWGKMFNLRIICFKGVGSTTKQFMNHIQIFQITNPSDAWRYSLMGRLCFHNIQKKSK